MDLGHDGARQLRRDGVDLALVIRFSAPIPDLSLHITSPKTTNTATLSTLIRPTLPPDLSSCPLRYIYSGALIQQNATLDQALRLGRSTSSQKSYIHCSISTSTKLTVSELEAEAKAASALNDNFGQISENLQTLGRATTDPAIEEPQGFDRLLSSGFTATEVASLRSQFLAIQSHTNTPDTMPTGTELRMLEERWLDTNNAGGPEPSRDGEGSGGGLEDMLWGNVMGFFWAFGALVWLLREEGVWTKRRQIGVLTGVLVNVLFCVLRAGG